MKQAYRQNEQEGESYLWLGTASRKRSSRQRMMCRSQRHVWISPILALAMMLSPRYQFSCGVIRVSLHLRTFDLKLLWNPEFLGGNFFFHGTWSIAYLAKAEKINIPPNLLATYRLIVGIDNSSSASCDFAWIRQGMRNANSIKFECVRRREIFTEP